MKPDAVPGISVALVYLALAIQVHPVLQISRAIVERRARAALASLAMAKIDALGFPGGNDTEGPAMALPDPFYGSLLNISVTTPHCASHTFAAVYAVLNLVTIRSCAQSRTSPCRMLSIASLELAGPFDNRHILLLRHLRNVSGLGAHPF